jgi:hypothetical protein
MCRFRTLVIAVTLAAALAACGSGGSDHAAGARLSTSALAVVRNAAQTTTDAKTAKLTLIVRATSSAGGTGGSGANFTITADGVTDYANHTADISLDFGDLAKQLPSGALGSGDLTFEERVVGDTIYMKLPAALTSLAGGSAKPWTKVDASRILGGLGGSSMSSGTDPTQALAYLSGVSDDVRKVGTETVRGVDTTHYTATLDLRKALDKRPSSLQGDDQYKKLLDQTISQLGTSTFPADVWIDGQGRLARISYALTLPAAGRKVAVSYSMELYDFGVPVDVQAPPADQVGDVGSSLLSGAQSSAAGNA